MHYQCVNFQFASVAGAGVDLTNQNDATEFEVSDAVNVLRKLSERGFVRDGRPARSATSGLCFRAVILRIYRSCRNKNS